MQMRLINLERSTDRLALFHARNPALHGITRVVAIDGKTVDRKAMVANGVLEAGLRYSDGALGCALSHLRLWRDAVQSDQVMTVIEDDAILCDNFEAEATRTLSLLPEDWDYVMWGYNFDAPLTFHLGAKLSHCTCMFSQDMLRSDATTFCLERVETSPFKLLRGFGTMAYSISPRGAERLINFCLPLRPLTTVHPGLPGAVPNLGIDNMLAHAWPSMSAHVSVPPLAISDNDLEASTVQSAGGQKLSYNQDEFLPAAFATVVEALGCTDGFVVGLRATHAMELPTARLRQCGWGGFDIAVDPAKVVKALSDRAVPVQFELLYVGPGCDLRGLLSAILRVFQPKAIIMPPENSLLAHQLARAQFAGATAPGYADFARSKGYSFQDIAGAPGHWLLLRENSTGFALERLHDEAGGSSLGQVDPVILTSRQSEGVRLWH